MKFNIRNLKLKKSRKPDQDLIREVNSNQIRYISDVDHDFDKDIVNLENNHYEPANCLSEANNNKPSLLSVRTTTKMKRGNNNVKQGERFIKNITLKSIGVSLANFFKPSRRIVRNQQNILIDNNCVYFPQFTKFHPNAPNAFKSQMKQDFFYTPKFKNSKLQTDAERSLKDPHTPRNSRIKHQFATNDLIKRPPRSLTLTNLYFGSNDSIAEPQLSQTTKSQSNLPTRKAQPSMGVLAHSLKSKIWDKCSRLQQSQIDDINSNVSKQNYVLFAYSQKEVSFRPIGKHLGQFLDAIDKNVSIEPIASSTMNLEISEDELTIVTPVYNVNKRRGNKKMRSLSVANVSEISILNKTCQETDYF